MLAAKCIVDSRERSSMAGVWTEYLVLERGTTKRFKLFTGRYEALAHVSEYWNDETDDCDMPEQINGITVVGWEDEWLVGGALSPTESEESIECDSFKESQVKAWAALQGWDIRKVRPAHLGTVLDVASLGAKALKKTAHLTPDLSGRPILYKGRRYIAFGVSAAAPFDGYESDFNFVIWDTTHDAATAIGTVMADGTVRGQLAFSLVDVDIPTSVSMAEFIGKSRKIQDRYCRESGTSPVPR